MKRTNIYLDEERLRLLKHLAADERASVAELVRRAVDAYLVQHLEDDARWREQWRELVEQVQARIPAAVTPAEIEAEITEARREVREAHRAARGR